MSAFFVPRWAFTFLRLAGLQIFTYIWLSSPKFCSGAFGSHFQSGLLSNAQIVSSFADPGPTGPRRHRTSGPRPRPAERRMGLRGFVEGGIASVVAGCSTHPLDLIKVRMQLQGESTLRPALAFAGSQGRIPTGPISVGIRVVRTEGLLALYSGVSATVLRQLLYSTTRMGLYDALKRRWQDPGSNPGSLPLAKKIAAGLVAGGVGAAVGNPADVAMVRMQADGRLPPAERRNYKSVADAIRRMARQEGVTSLWTGSSLTVQRAMLVTASQLASYDQIKETILAGGLMRDGLATHVTASFAAGFVASVVSNPVDVVKTRIMNMKPEPGRGPPYAGALDCALKTVKAEGPMALYKGFVPTVTRQGPYTVVLFVTLEQVRKVLKDF